MIGDGRPRFVITANLNFAMLAATNAALRAAARRAAFVVADGMPLVWAARFKGQPLPGRVTGSDLVPAICKRAGERGHRVVLAGGGAGVAQVAATRLQGASPGLRITALDAPHFRSAGAHESEALVERIRSASPDILLLACSQPEGELWLAEHCERIGVPVCVQIGAAIDFVAGRIRRAPRWVQAAGLEWAFRLLNEPRRLGPRYWKNVYYLATGRA
jgi:N-acetylglucosaminyldiphosphoundecaprenol N-acetyl-beta-D-mannosaminyltransferase